MQIGPILWPCCAVRVDAETAGVITDIRRLNPHVDGCGNNIVAETRYLIGERKDFVIAVFILLHYYALTRPARFSGYFDPTAIFLGVCGAQKSNQSNCFTGTYAFPNVFLIPAIIVSKVGRGDFLEIEVVG